MISKIKQNIARLKKLNPSVAVIAQNQLDLLISTKASYQDFVEFNRDVLGAIAAYAE